MITESQAVSSSTYVSEEGSSDKPDSEFNREVHLVNVQERQYGNCAMIIRFENRNIQQHWASEARHKGNGRELQFAPPRYPV
jgi:hypothetical protein